MKVKRFLVDVNLVLDWLLDRKPHESAATALCAAIEQRPGSGLLPAHGITTIHYLARRARGVGFARKAMTDLLGLFEVASVDGRILRRAASLEWPDFEDAVCAAAAEAAGCDALVSRNPSDFPDSPVPVIDPATALSWLTAD